MQDGKDDYTSSFVSSLEVTGMSSDIYVNYLLIGGCGKESSLDIWEIVIRGC